MKQNIYIEQRAFSPNGQNIKMAEAGSEKTKHLGLLPFTDCSIAAANPPALFLDMDCQVLGRDGPPGRARSPGAHFMRGLPIGLCPQFNSTIIQPNFIKLKFNHLQTLNSQIMKKQILFVVVFILAMLGGITDSYGQDPVGLTTFPATCLEPTEIVATCLTNDALTPIPGKEYPYTVEVLTPDGTKEFNWFVTTDKNFITTDPTTFATTLTDNSLIELNNGTSPHILSSGTGYNDPGNTGTTTINMTWKPFTHDPANPVFLVIYVTNEGVTPNICTTDNIQVYIIKPQHSFTLDVANIALDGTYGAVGEATDGPCAALVTSAAYDVTSEKVLMKYGINYLFFIVTAANYNDSWLPSFQVSGEGITGTAGDRVVTAIDWQYSTVAAQTGTGWVETTVAGADVAGTYTYTGTSANDKPVVASSASNGVVPADGECIIVRVTVDNGRIETALGSDDIIFAVDGVMKDGTKTDVDEYYATASLGDIHFDKGSNVGEECPWVDEFTNDRVTQRIMPRPNIVTETPDAPATGTLPFVPKN